MMNIYLFIIIFFAGIMEFNKFFKCEKKLEKRCTLIIAISYFCELIFLILLNLNRYLLLDVVYQELVCLVR